MITIELILKNIKLLGIAALIVCCVWFYKDYQHQKSENLRQTENVVQLRKADSLRFCVQKMTADEMKRYFEFQNKQLLDQLTKAGIKTNRIKEIVSVKYNYKDTLVKKYPVGPFVDSSQCLVIRGYVDSSGVIIQNRQFKNKMDAVAYWQRRQWSFLGIKTRFLGKKEMTAKVFDDCGESRVIKIEKVQ
jgi:mRNA-degrading endonuclease HigB of HigAB toxin-antitoxin module